MTDPVSVGLSLVTLVVAVLAGWLQWPTTPPLDGERWFKASLATLFLGETDAAGVGEEAWVAKVQRFVLYHPAGRFPERKVVQPLADPPGARVPGELALQEKLASLPDLPSRWAWMYDQDPVAAGARLADPQDLGPLYDPATRLGQGHDWQALARWGAGEAALRDALLRRVGCRWALVEGRPGRLAGPSLGEALAREIPELARFPWTEAPLPEQVESLRARLTALAPDAGVRVVVLAEEAGLILLLRAMQSDAGLRDLVAAVVSVGGSALGRPDEPGPFGERDARDWMETWFTLNHLDAELVRLRPFLAAQWLDRSTDPPGAGGLPLGHQRFPDPRDDGVIATFEVIDLGPLPVDPELPLDQVARALIAVTGLWVLART